MSYFDFLNSSTKRCASVSGDQDGILMVPQHHRDKLWSLEIHVDGH